MDMNESPQTPQPSPQPPVAPPVQPPIQPPVVPPAGPQQPPVPGGQAPQNQTDVMGIISIVLPFVGLSLVGLVVGLIGASKAKREGRSPILSRIGWIISLVVVLISIALFALLVALGVQQQQEKDAARSSNSSSLSSAEVDANSRKVSVDGFSLVVPNDFADIPEEYRNTSANYTQGDDATNEYALVIKESAGDFRDSMTVQDYADLLNEDYKSGDSVTGAVISPLTDVANGGNLDAVDYMITGESGDIQVVYYIRYVKTATSFYQIMTWTSPSSIAFAQPDLYSILESFREE